MPSNVQQLMQKGLIKAAPKFLETGIHYEVVMGSMAYGVSNDSSDMDVYGFAIPPKDFVFPHLRGEIPGFDQCKQGFEHYQEHHIQDPTALGGRGREYDVVIYSIMKYFRLLLENNPNIIDSLYVPRNCVLHSTQVGELVRENRSSFLHKGCWAKFKGYAYSQMHKMRTKDSAGKRKELVNEFGYDVKFGYHVVRLLNEVEQLLTEKDLDLTRHKEQLKAIRRGEWSLQRLEEHFNSKEKQLETHYDRCDLPAKPNTEGIRQLLAQCLELHYGSLDECLKQQNQDIQALREIQKILDKIQLN